jgi:hypothetical protein
MTDLGSLPKGHPVSLLLVQDQALEGGRWGRPMQRLPLPWAIKTQPRAVGLQSSRLPLLVAWAFMTVAVSFVLHHIAMML